MIGDTLLTTTAKPPAHPRRLGDHSWQNRAACQGIDDPELFFPEPERTDRIATAKELCAQCPVAKECLDAALEAGDRDGIRGGMTEKEREPLHRNLHRRLDRARVDAALAGRDVHLSERERRAVIRTAYLNQVPASRLAWILKVTEEHAEKLYRQVRKHLPATAIRDAAAPRGMSPVRDRSAVQEVA
jgi:WhiB family redox-sensing transcriptional regulator